jgi:hypothetical protein
MKCTERISFLVFYIIVIIIMWIWVFGIDITIINYPRDIFYFILGQIFLLIFSLWFCWGAENREPFLPFCWKLYFYGNSKIANNGEKHIQNIIIAYVNVADDEHSFSFCSANKIDFNSFVSFDLLEFKLFNLNFPSKL